MRTGEYSGICKRQVHMNATQLLRELRGPTQRRFATQYAIPRKQRTSIKKCSIRQWLNMRNAGLRNVTMNL